MAMPSGKAPRPDGFTIDLFKSCWSFMKYEFHALKEDSRLKKIVLVDMNSMVLTLIAKDEGVDSLNRF